VATIAAPTRAPRAPLSSLGRLTIAALVGLSFAYAYVIVALIREFTPMAVMIPAPLILATVVASRWRFAPLLAAAFCVLTLAPELPILPSHLGDPADSFIVNVVLVPALFGVGILAGLGAFVQNLRLPAEQRLAPRWLAPALLVLLGLVIGGSLVAFRPAARGLTLSPAQMAALPALTTADFAYAQTEIRARVGQPVALRLENTDSFFHRFDLDAFDVHVPMFSGSQALALFVPTEAGSFDFYCDLPGHEGMRGTLIVEP
jgi:heme/copper-type cytochrome/quinol oxidase subunit 2